MRRFGASVVAAFLFAGISQVQAALVSITVDEPNDNPPTVTTSSGFEGTPTFTSAFETASVTAFVLGSSLKVGTTSVILVEPSADPFNQPTSDLITLQIFAATTDGATSQQVNLNFFSDSFIGPNGQTFADLVRANPNAVPVAETGSLSDITQQLGLPFDGGALVLQVQASSDLTTPEIPEPGSLALVGIGVAGLFGYGSWKRKPAA
jgi:hypothetical protein